MSKNREAQNLSPICSSVNLRCDETSVNVADKKMTEVGLIPSDWEIVRLDQVAIVKGGKRLPKGASLTAVPTGHPYIRVTDMTKGSIDTSDLLYVPELVALSIKNYRVTGEDLFISVAGTLGLVGKVPAILDGANLTENANRITRIELNREFLMYWLLSDFIQSEIESASTIGAQPKLALGRIEMFAVPLPKMKKEQAAISKALSDVDALIGSLETLIEKKQAIKTGAMQQLLTGRIRLPQFALREDSTPKEYKTSELGNIPEDWDVVPFGHVLSIRHGKSQRGVESTYGKYPIYATGGQIGSASAFLYDRPSVLIGRKGTIDKPRFVDTPFWTVDTLFYSEVQDYADPKFIFYKFCMVDWMQYNEASGVPSLSSRTVESLTASFPSAEEQRAIAKVLTDIDLDIQTLEKRLDKTRAIRRGMMQELLTGKTRLI